MVSNILTKDRKIRNRKIILSFFALQDYAVTKKKKKKKETVCYYRTRKYGTIYWSSHSKLIQC